MMKLMARLLTVVLLMAAVLASAAADQRGETLT